MVTALLPDLGKLLILLFLDSLPEVFGYPAGSGRLLLSAELPLRYYSGNFASRKPSWSLPEVGGFQALLTAGGPDVRLFGAQAGRCVGGEGGGHLNTGGCWTKGAGGMWKRVRLTKNTVSSLVRRHGALHVLHGKRWKKLHAFGEVLEGECSNRRGRLS